ncbi:carbohydrate binding domain-containing protein [Streptomyces sp. MI02-2A]|uniref:carbohydrate binding domain-containing protein n=1 Tax=Streptomyces sp. MI02-2A TaxID=3028688 RepID=UPI0029B9CE59|nr:carbohydrate binding domain-containing protein [Streptomyces sp. MI02-2A]MDX3260708.1 carbohydrate binding domain-containing protein [Streptomyces sp. MI02-2A]
MTDIEFFDDPDDFAPIVTIRGNIQALVHHGYGPQLDGSLTFDGDLTVIIPRPKPVAPKAGVFTIQGDFKALLKEPAAAFKDFAHYPFSGVDPAMAMIGQTSGSLASGAVGSYKRQFAMFTAPVDYPVSGGGFAWKRAAYASVGFKFANMSGGTNQILDAVQLELAPLGMAGPTAYQNARQIQVVIKPTRLNYALNPNFESGIGNVRAVTSDAHLSADSFCWQGTQALKVTIPSAASDDTGMSIQASGLKPGKTYTMSARVAIAAGCGEILPFVGAEGKLVGRNTWTTAANAVDPTKPRWRTVYVTFTASVPLVTVGMNVLKSTMPPGVTSIFWVDGMMVEEGFSPRPYFDGSMGSDYVWDVDGQPNLTRSYYYENRLERSFLIRTLLKENTPLGIAASEPKFGVLPEALPNTGS